MAEAPIRVLAVDDHPLMRHGIAAVVDAEPDMRVIAEAKDGLDAIDQCRKHRPDVVLMDVRMPRLDGIRAATALREEFPEVRVMMLATHSGDLQERLALRAGASGYLLKSAMRRDLVHAIRDLNRNSAGRRSWGHHRDAVNDESILTMREVEVLEAIAAGQPNAAVAANLAITQGTVKSHLKSIFAKLGARDRTHAVVLGYRRGVIPLPSWP